MLPMTKSRGSSRGATAPNAASASAIEAGLAL
jgi:hypothetical protein